MEKAVEGVNSAAAVDNHAEADKDHQHGHEHHDMTEEHSIIGISLVVGFIFMLLVDQMGGSLHSHSSSGKGITF